MRDHRTTRGVDTMGYLERPGVRFRVGLMAPVTPSDLWLLAREHTEFQRGRGVANATCWVPRKRPRPLWQPGPAGTGSRGRRSGPASPAPPSPARGVL